LKTVPENRTPNLLYQYKPEGRSSQVKCDKKLKETVSIPVTGIGQDILVAIASLTSLVA